MSTSETRQQLIEKIKQLPAKLEATVAHLTDEQLDTPYGEGKWTVRQVVHHVADSHMNANARFKGLLTEDNPTVKVYDQDKYAKLPDMHLPLEPSFEILRGLHYRWGVMLEGLDDSVWSRTIQHPEDGEYNLDTLLKAYANHGEKHIGHITGLLDAKGWR